MRTVPDRPGRVGVRPSVGVSVALETACRRDPNAAFVRSAWTGSTSAPVRAAELPSALRVTRALGSRARRDVPPKHAVAELIEDLSEDARSCVRQHDRRGRDGLAATTRTGRVRSVPPQTRGSTRRPVGTSVGRGGRTRGARRRSKRSGGPGRRRARSLTGRRPARRARGLGHWGEGGRVRRRLGVGGRPDRERDTAGHPR